MLRSNSVGSLSFFFFGSSYLAVCMYDCQLFFLPLFFLLCRIRFGFVLGTFGRRVDRCPPRQHESSWAHEELFLGCSIVRCAKRKRDFFFVDNLCSGEKLRNSVLLFVCLVSVLIIVFSFFFLCVCFIGFISCIFEVSLYASFFFFSFIEVVSGVVRCSMRVFKRTHTHNRAENRLNPSFFFFFLLSRGLSPRKEKEETSFSRACTRST